MVSPTVDGDGGVVLELIIMSIISAFEGSEIDESGRRRNVRGALVVTKLSILAKN